MKKRINRYPSIRSDDNKVKDIQGHVNNDR